MRLNQMAAGKEVTLKEHTCRHMLVFLTSEMSEDFQKIFSKVIWSADAADPEEISPLL